MLESTRAISFHRTLQLFLLESKWRGGYHYFFRCKEEISLGVKQNNESNADKYILLLKSHLEFWAVGKLMSESSNQDSQHLTLNLRGDLKQNI